MARVAQLIPEDETYIAWKVFTPDFSQGFREDMLKIPQQMRHWNGEEKCWVVDSDWVEHCERLLRRYYPDAVIERQD